MSKKSKLIWIFAAVLLIAANILLAGWHRYDIPTVPLTARVSADVRDDLQIFYSDYVDSWVEEQSSTSGYVPEENETMALPLRFGAFQSYIRLDLGSKAKDGTWYLESLTVGEGEETETIPVTIFADPLESHSIASCTMEGETLVIRTHGEDPYLIAAMPDTAAAAAAREKADRRVLVTKLLAFLLLDGTALAFVLFGRRFLSLPLELYQNRHLIFKLAVNDFKTRYAGSYLGIIWAFVQPVVTILVYWFVFSVGFRSGAVMQVPFVVYLVSGLVPWFYIQEFLNTGTNALIEYSYLVKKVVFKISVLPMVKAISAFFVHAFFIAITIIITLLYGINPGPCVIQVIYYFLAMFVFSLGIVYGTCAVVIFFRDLSQIINILLQVGVWTIPIMWNLQIVDEKYHWIFKLNPMYYVVNGYRESIYGHVPFWHDLGQMVYFWTFTLILFVIGTVIFKRLKVHFADVL